jgi:hypothetical protein
MTKAYLIDPFVCEVKPVELHSEPGTFDELHDIYALIDCEHIESVHPYNAGGDLMYIDEDGKINGKAQEYFMCRVWPHDALAGKALWIGSDTEGNNADPEMTIDYVRDHIVWAYRY